MSWISRSLQFCSFYSVAVIVNFSQVKKRPQACGKRRGKCFMPRFFYTDQWRHSGRLRCDVTLFLLFFRPPTFSEGGAQVPAFQRRVMFNLRFKCIGVRLHLPSVKSVINYFTRYVTHYFQVALPLMCWFSKFNVALPPISCNICVGKSWSHSINSNSLLVAPK